MLYCIPRHLIDSTCRQHSSCIASDAAEDSAVLQESRDQHVESANGSSSVASQLPIQPISVDDGAGAGAGAGAAINFEQAVRYYSIIVVSCRVFRRFNGNQFMFSAKLNNGGEDDTVNVLVLLRQEAFCEWQLAYC